MGNETGVSAKQAVRVAEQYITDTIAIMDAGRADPRWAPVIDQLRAGMTANSAEANLAVRLLQSELAATFGVQCASLIGVSVATAEAAKLWRRHRVVYRLHQGLADSLLETDTRTAVPCEVLARLPHPDPFVVFPTPLPAPISAGGAIGGQVMAEPPMIVGMLVTALNAHEGVCSTTDPAARMLNLSIAVRSHYQGQPPGHEENTVLIPMAGTRTIDELINHAREFVHSGDIGSDQQRRMYNLAISVLLYLCSDQQDARPHRPAYGTRKSKKPRQPSQPVIDLGFDIGPALHAARRTGHNGTDSDSTALTTSNVRPHLRRAHWHTYWTGPRTNPTPEVRWLHPILVNRTENAARATVVDVAARR